VKIISNARVFFCDNPVDLMVTVSNPSEILDEQEAWNVAPLDRTGAGHCIPSGQSSRHFPSSPFKNLYIRHSSPASAAIIAFEELAISEACRNWYSIKSPAIVVAPSKVPESVTTVMSITWPPLGFRVEGLGFSDFLFLAFI